MILDPEICLACGERYVEIEDFCSDCYDEMLDEVGAQFYGSMPEPTSEIDEREPPF